MQPENFSDTSNIMEIFIAILSSGLLNVIITNFLYRHKLKKQQKIGQENMLGEKINDALIQMRNVELKCKTTEIYNVEHEIKNITFDAFNVRTVYLSIFQNEDTFNVFVDQINELRKEKEKYLGYKESALLLFMSTYCINLRKYIVDHNLRLEVAGVAFLYDFQAWQCSCEKILQKRLNKPKYKIYNKNSYKWIREKKRMMRKMWKKTILYKAIYKIDDISEIFDATILNHDFVKIEEILRKEIEFQEQHRIKCIIRNFKNRIRY